MAHPAGIMKSTHDLVLSLIGCGDGSLVGRTRLFRCIKAACASEELAEVLCAKIEAVEGKWGTYFPGAYDSLEFLDNLGLIECEGEDPYRYIVTEKGLDAIRNLLKLQLSTLRALASIKDRA